MTGAQRNQKMGRAVICTQIRLSPRVLILLSRQLPSPLSASLLWTIGDSKAGSRQRWCGRAVHQRIWQESPPGPAALAAKHGGGGGGRE